MAAKDKGDDKKSHRPGRVPEPPPRHDYEILDEIECGSSSMGSEVKSIRNGKVTIDEAFGRVENGELWLFSADIAEYPQASYMNHVRKRAAKTPRQESATCGSSPRPRSSGVHADRP